MISAIEAPVQTSYLPKSDNSLKKYVFPQNSICQKQSVKNDPNKFHMISLCNMCSILKCVKDSVPPLPPSVLILGTFVSFHALFNQQMASLIFKVYRCSHWMEFVGK